MTWGQLHVVGNRSKVFLDMDSVMSTHNCLPFFHLVLLFLLLFTL